MRELVTADALYSERSRCMRACVPWNFSSLVVELTKGLRKLQETHTHMYAFHQARDALSSFHANRQGMRMRFGGFLFNRENDQKSCKGGPRNAHVSVSARESSKYITSPKQHRLSKLRKDRLQGLGHSAPVKPVIEQGPQLLAQDCARHVHVRFLELLFNCGESKNQA